MKNTLIADNFIFTLNCPKCGTSIEHNYTEHDVYYKLELNLKCQTCGYAETYNTKKLRKELHDMADYISVQNQVEYFKNGNVKAYISYLYHSKLNKKIKVSHREHYIYSQKFDNAKKLLEMEWRQVSDNKNVKDFVEKATTLHKYSSYMYPFKYDNYSKTQIEKLNNVKLYTLKLKENITVPNEPNNNDDKYIFIPKWYHKIFVNIEKRKECLHALFLDDMKKHNEKLQRSNEIKKHNENEYSKLKDSKEMHKKRARELESKYSNLLNNYKNILSEEDVACFFSTIFDSREELYDIYKKIDIQINFESEDKTLIVDFELPKNNLFPKYKEKKIIKTKLQFKEILFSEKERNDIVIDSYYSLYIAIINEISKYDICNILSSIILNAYYNGMDTRTGKSFRVCTMSSKVNVDEFRSFNLLNINPKDTFKHFSGRGIPNPKNITKVEPIRFSNKSQFKVIDSDSVLANLSAETNLAALDWRDFETLIKEVFELEFKEENIEIRNTQHSSDGGIDVVAFNNNPYYGGIILLQAKSYTNTVNPEPVRALKGSMDDYMATRGILVTTSSFGASSREFAQNNNITLINGDQLIDIFKKHGFNYHINLEQAKILRNNN